MEQSSLNPYNFQTIKSTEGIFCSTEMTVAELLDGAGPQGDVPMIRSFPPHPFSRKRRRAGD